MTPTEKKTLIANIVHEVDRVVDLLVCEDIPFDPELFELEKSPVHDLYLLRALVPSGQIVIELTKDQLVRLGAAVLDVLGPDLKFGYLPGPVQGEVTIP